MGALMQDHAGKTHEEIDCPDRHRNSPDAIERIGESDNDTTGNEYEKKTTDVHNLPCANNDGR